MSHPEMLRPGDPMTRLHPQRRDRDLAAIRSGAAIDVLVVGGGVTGAGVALDAASRGLRTVLVERHDLAHGTSRWSSKLIHGGLRYLARGDVRIAWESAVERAVIGGRVAPHLVRPMTQVLPLPEDRDAAAILARAGLLAADALRVGARTPRGLLARSTVLSRAELLRLAPALDPRGLRGGLAIADLQLEDDARFVTALARTAAGYGARILTRVSVEQIQQDGVLVRERTTGEAFRLSPRAVVNATGVWAGELDPAAHLSPSRGTHLVVRSSALRDSGVSIAVPVPGSSSRFVFTLPQPDGLTYVGITDEPAPGPVPEVPQAPDGEVEWILQVLNTALGQPVAMADVVGRFAGLRPLLAGDGGAGSADLSRRHTIMRSGRLITVTGGKFTAYRRMAQDVVDLLSTRPCRTRNIALVGAGPRSGSADVPDRLWRRYGTEAPLVWSCAAAEETLGRPLAPGCPVLGVEVAFALDWEGAHTAQDVLARRTRLALVPADEAAARPAVARIIEQRQERRLTRAR